MDTPEHHHNPETREVILSQAEAALNEVFSDYRSQGLAAVYLWGSVLREDFNPESSDVDSIGIAQDQTPFELEQEIQSRLMEKIPSIKKFGFRIIYSSELAGGPIKGFLSSVQSPKSHLLDLPNWQLVAGRDFKQSDFATELPTFHEAMLDEIPELRRHQQNYEAGDVEDYPNFIKKIAQIVDLLQKERGASGRFSYSEILSRAAEGLEKQTAAALVEIKSAGYDAQVIKKHDKTLKEFINYIYSLVRER